MTSQDCSGGSGGILAASSDAADDAAVREVQSLKALSLNGLNKHMCQSSSATPADDISDAVSRGARPKPRLSWGNVTEIPGGAADTTHAYEKHSGLPAGGASSSGNPWQVRSTQNPSRPLVRRPTPMALIVSKSVLGRSYYGANASPYPTYMIYLGGGDILIAQIFLWMWNRKRIAN